MSKFFYSILKAISNTDIVPHACDYRMLDRQVVDKFNKLSELNRMTRGLIDWLGFERDYVYFEVAPRHSGEASYSLSKLIGLAFNSITAYSLFPLRLAGYIGVLIMVFSGSLGLFIWVEQIILGDPWELAFSGVAQLATLILFLIGVVLASLGLVALYIAHIHTEVVNRPLYVLRQDKRKKSKR